MQKKRFILELPYFLATDAGSLSIKLMFAACYALLIASYTMPVFGTFAVTAACLIFWQFFNVVVKKDLRYKIYCSFLLQRLLFCNIFTLVLFFYCNKTDIFNEHLWLICCAVLAAINVSDIYFTLKGFIGIGFIHDKKNKN